MNGGAGGGLGLVGFSEFSRSDKEKFHFTSLIFVTNPYFLPHTKPSALELTYQDI
jgi:hypothetical protein